MTVERLKDILGFSIDRAGAAAGADPDVLRLENLDTLCVRYSLWMFYNAAMERILYDFVHQITHAIFFST